MKPLFSVCACRILKINSCFRIPEAPWMLRSFAICVSDAMFISFNCAMSIVAAPSGRSEATNFLLIGGFLLTVWDFSVVRLHGFYSGLRPCQNPSLPRKQLSPWFLVFQRLCGAPELI